MTRTRKILTCSVAMALLLGPLAGVLLQAQTDRAHEIGKRVKCSCGGCEQSAGGCYHPGGAFAGPCPVAKKMIAEIQGHIDRGLSDQQALDAMIKEYGTTAYIEPPKTGFGLVAWIMPVVYLVVGLGLVLLIVSKWRKRGIVAETIAAKQNSVSPEMLERARILAQRATEE